MYIVSLIKNERKTSILQTKKISLRFWNAKTAPGLLTLFIRRCEEVRRSKWISHNFQLNVPKNGIYRLRSVLGFITPSWYYRQDVVWNSWKRRICRSNFEEGRLYETNAYWLIILNGHWNYVWDYISKRMKEAGFKRFCNFEESKTAWLTGREKLPIFTTVCLIFDPLLSSNCPVRYLDHAVVFIQGTMLECTMVLTTRWNLLE